MYDMETTLAMATSITLGGDAAAYIKGKVLDVGCGYKPYRRLFPDCEWVGVDTRPVGDIQADAHDLSSVEDGSYDSVLCTELLHLCVSPLRVVQEMARVLKPGGHIVITAPNVHAVDAFWGIKPAGLNYLFQASELEPIKIWVDGRVVSQEWGSMTQFEKSGIQMPPIGGWLDQMDQRYPAISVGIAKKGE